MLHVEWAQASTVMRPIFLESRPESSFEHVRHGSLVLLVTEGLERVLVLNLHLVMIGKGVRCSVIRLNDAVWWVTEMVDLIF